MIRVLITGDRRWECLSVARAVVGRLVLRYGRDAVLIVHGAASGVDSAFEEAARAASVATEPHPARWDDLEAPGAVIRRRKDGAQYNANAGPRRNAEMVEAGAAFVVACHAALGRSKGTRGCVELALRAGIPCYLIAANDCKAVRVVGFDRYEVRTRGAVGVESG